MNDRTDVFWAYGVHCEKCGDLSANEFTEGFWEEWPVLVSRELALSAMHCGSPLNVLVGQEVIENKIERGNEEARRQSRPDDVT